MRILDSKVHKSFLILTLLVFAAFSAGFATKTVLAEEMSFKFLVGSGLLCSLATNACPDVSMASNGDTISIAGSGTLSIHPKSVEGSGTFTHKSSAGAVLATGTWTATKLVKFESFGNALPQGLPSNFFGGRALIRVTLFVGSTPVHTALLTIFCELGTPPAGIHEGVALNVHDALNFNTQVSGFTLFILSSDD